MLWFGVVWWRLAWRDFGIVGQVCVGVAWHAWRRVASRGMVWRGVVCPGDPEEGRP